MIEPRNEFMNDLYQQILARRGARAAMGPAMVPQRQMPIPRVKPTVSTIDDSGMGPGIPGVKKPIPIRDPKLLVGTSPYTPPQMPSPYTPPAPAITQPLVNRRALVGPRGNISGGGRPGVGSEGGLGTTKEY